MSAEEPTIYGPLSEDCAELLGIWGFYAQPATIATIAHIRYDNSDELVVSVPVNISRPMLQLLFDFGGTMFSKGVRQGEVDAKHRIRAAIGL